MSKASDFICKNTLFQKIRLNLVKFKALALASDGLKQAAVAIAVVDVFHGPDLNGLSKPGHWDKTAALILTQRTSHLRHHSV